MNFGVKWERKDEQECQRPDDGTDDERVAAGSIANRLEWVNDGQIAVDAHQRHGEYTRVQVHSPERVHQSAGQTAEHPAPNVRTVGDEGQGHEKQVVGDGKIEDETRRNRSNSMMPNENEDSQRVSTHSEHCRDQVQYDHDVPGGKLW